ncbi:hypothetical protein DRN93_01430 [archaeon]|nr:MAG: hypothetical protein DRN93_01430 [archaeon]
MDVLDKVKHKEVRDFESLRDKVLSRITKMRYQVRQMEKELKEISRDIDAYVEDLNDSRGRDNT